MPKRIEAHNKNKKSCGRVAATQRRLTKYGYDLRQLHVNLQSTDKQTHIHTYICTYEQRLINTTDNYMVQKSERCAVTPANNELLPLQNQ